MSDANQTLSELHALLAENLRLKLTSGACTTAELNVIRQFLKDNNISGRAVPRSPLGSLVEQLDLTAEDEEYLRSQKVG